MMKKIIIFISIAVILFGVFSPVSFVDAQVDKYQPLAPLPGIGENNTPLDLGGKSALGDYLNPMIKIVIGLSAVLAVVMIVIGGMEYMTSELVHSKEAGKSKMTNAVLGLVIALGSFALLNTINSDLLKSDIEISQINLEIAINDNVPQTYDPTTKKYRNGATHGTPLTGTVPPKCTTNTQTGCLPLFVTINKSECTTVGQSNCTSTRGLDMNQLRAVQWGCGCPLVLTGGTEWWLHGGQSGNTNHQPGRTTVDIRTNNDPNSALNKYLSGGKPLVPMQWYQSPVGLILYEGNHWHIGS